MCASVGCDDQGLSSTDCELPKGKAEELSLLLTTVFLLLALLTITYICNKYFQNTCVNALMMEWFLKLNKLSCMKNCIVPIISMLSWICANLSAVESHCCSQNRFKKCEAQVNSFHQGPWIRSETKEEKTLRKSWVTRPRWQGQIKNNRLFS